MSNNNPSFRPVRLNEKMLNQISKSSNQDGYLYFTTDTQKIYMGMPNGEILSMGGNTGIFYANKEIEYPDDGNEPNPEVIFYLDKENEFASEIEGTRLPQVDDLILNVDGCFYRVTDVLDELSVKTNRITLQGSGSSSGGGESSATLRISAPSGTNKIYSSSTDSIIIDVIAFSSDTSNYISMVECSFDQNFTDVFLSYNLQYPLEKIYNIDLISQKNKFSDIGKRVYLRITDRYGVTRSLYYTITLAKLELSQMEDAIIQITGASFMYSCLIGGSVGIEDRQLEYRFYNSDGIEIIEYAQFYQLEANQSSQIQKQINVSAIQHGSYELRVSLTGKVGTTLITSNILSHKIIRYDNEIAQPIFTYLLPNKFEQYTDIPINYMLVYGDTQKSYIMDIYINEEFYSSKSVRTGKIEQQVFLFDKSGSYKIEMKIAELNIDESFNINVEKYTGILPVVNIDRDDLQVYLTAKGRTNSVANKEYWPDYKNSSMKATLSNFYYRNVNGWMVDNKGVNCLKVSQGASVEFSDYSPYSVNPMNKGLTIELDFMIDGILDYDQNLIECLSLYNDKAIKTGFVVKGDTFKYYASGKELVSLNLVEGKRIKLSFVIEPKSIQYPLCYTYLDGIISNVTNYDLTHDFVNNPENPGYLKINSIGGQVYIYNIRFYSSNLDASTILNNYQATLDSLEDRQANYEENLIRDLLGDINLEKIESEDYNLQIPYVKITGGYQADKSFKMSKKATNNTPSLPVGKKDYRSIDIEIIYPKVHQNAYFKDYKDFKVTTTFDDPALNVLNGFEHTPSEGAIMYAQGTSSLEYPVKNLRVSLKGKKFTVRPDIAPVELVTFKADFMESAGAHNTGAANYIDDLYKGIDIETPGQKQFKNRDKGTIVTCIKGHPCVIFWNPGVDENGNELSREPKNYKFIGKYNFNLDKATPEPFGFMHDEQDESFGYTINEDGEKVNSIYCFEFLDNNEKVCNFIHDAESTYVDYSVEDPEDKEYELNDKTEQERYYDSWYSQRINEEGKVVHGWRRGFESRYPEDKEDLHDADVLYRLASWINELYAMRYIEGKENEAIQKFKDEYQGYFDKEFLLAYYLITEVLLMADSRVKNMMIATWGKETREWEIGPEDAKVKKTVTDYIWYPIFYDMDTMLGLDNIGYVNKNYYDEDTDPKVFNGEEILWEFVRDGLSNELALEFNKIEQSINKSFAKGTIIPYFNENQATMANETFYNEDAFYKYIDTFRNGYTDHLHDKEIAPGTGSRLYAAQGNRAMMREFFIEHRIRYLRGKYLSTNYQEGDRIEFRLTYPTYKEVPDLPDESLTESQKEQKLINASIAAVPPSGEFEYTSTKTGYAGVKVGTAGKNYRFTGKQSRTLEVDTSSGNGTETYLLGISNLSDVGDLSDKYLYKLIVGTPQNNLKQLILGNHNKDYFNPFWGQETSIDLKGFRFLEKFSLENCGTFNGSINFTDSPQIKTILLNGSNTSALTLPIGGVLEELRLPSSLTNLYIDSHPDLNNDKFTLGYFDYDLDVYVNDFSKLAHVALIGVPNIDSYALIRSILFGTSNRLETYCFQDFHWQITDQSDLEYNEDGYVTGIKVLDILLGSSKAAYEGYTKSEALIGTLTIDVPGIKVNAFDIYQTYQFSCPNLIINYGDSVDLVPATEIKFYNIDTLAEGTKPYYSVLSNGNYNLEYLTSSIGPAGIKLPIPQKLATNDKTFTFSGNWIVYKSEDENIIINSKINQNDFKNIIPRGNLELIPEFIDQIRLYQVILYDYNEKLLIETQLPYNADIGLSLDYDTHSYYNYRPYDGNKEHYRYEFKGWQSEYDFNNKTNVITYTTLKGKPVTGKIKLYAYYQEENCLTTVSNNDYFQYLNNNILTIKDKYKNILQGKITLPSQNNGVYIKQINNNMLQNNTTITHIYFLEDAQYLEIGSYAFNKCTNLEYIINLPDSITKIDSISFQSCPKVKIDKLPKSLQEIGIGAFAFCYELSLDVLPENLTKIGTSSFEKCKELAIREFGTSNSAPNLQVINNLAFSEAGENINGDIILGKSLTNGESYLSIADGAFNKYGNNIVNLYVKESVKANVDRLGIIAENIIQGGP